MDRSDVRSFTDRVRAITGETPPTSNDETRAWIVDPLLETLGWNVRDSGCRTDVTVSDVHLEYVLRVGKTPMVFVATESYGDALRPRRANRLRSAMGQTGVDRAIYTDGRKLALLAGEDGADQFECSLESVHERIDALDHFSKRAAVRRLERDERRDAARRLAVDRTEVASTFADELASIAGERHRPAFRRASAEFLDTLAKDLLEDDDAASVEDETTSPRRLEFDGSTIDASSDGEGVTEPPTYSEPGSESEPQVEPPATADDGEYVVRFFGDRGSIGAIGHSNPQEATAQAAEYLLERGLGGVETPWGPDGSATVLNDRPTLEDGSPMRRFRELSSGLYLDTSGDVDELADRVAGMTERAGLRAMLTGDWSVKST